MDRGVERQPLVRPAEELRHQDQVPRARDRQELGDPLDDRENDDLNGFHAVVSCGANEGGS
jgi:hypothetical protein